MIMITKGDDFIPHVSARVLVSSLYYKPSVKDVIFKAPKRTHTPQTPTRTALAHSTRTKSTDPVYINDCEGLALLTNFPLD